MQRTSFRLFARSNNIGEQLAANTRRSAGVLLVSLLLVACTTPYQTRELLAGPPADLPVSMELTNTPFFPQERYQCGPAALATVLGTYGLPATPEELVDDVYVPALKGSLPEEIVATARQQGMLAYPLSARLDALLHEVAHGHPVIILQNNGTPWWPRWHFAVVIGYDLQQQVLLLRSGTSKRLQTSLATFERTWERGDYWARVIVPAGELPASALPEPYLQAAYDLETAGQTTAAQTAYQAATRQWPDNPLAWMTYANSLYSTRAHAQAEQAFHEVTRLEPDNPQGWNNLAYALLRNNCPRQAQRAARCAVRLAPDERNYRDTLKEINARAVGVTAASCKPLDCSVD